MFRLLGYSDVFYFHSGVEICFATVMDDCHYRGYIYCGQDPTHYIEEDPEFLSWDIDDLRIRDWKETEMLFVKLSGGRCKSSLATVLT